MVNFGAALPCGKRRFPRFASSRLQPPSGSPQGRFLRDVSGL